MARILAVLPAVNAALVFTSGLFILSGVAAIRRRDQATHRRRMLTATGFASVFLVLYLFRIGMQGTTTFTGPYPIGVIYYVILATHLVAAVVSTPLVLVTLYRGLTGKFAAHRRIARVAYPMWVYVAFTGVFVFGILHYPY